jgi:copper transport protein
MPSRVLAAIGVAMLALVAHPAAAGAHARVVSTTPAEGATVAELTRIVVRFAEPVETADAHAWLEAAGDVLPLGSPSTVDGDRKVIAVAVPELERGGYTARLHVVAEDGDAVSVAFSFTVAVPTTASEDVPVVVPVAPAHVHHDGELPTGAARVLLDAALASLIGGVAFVVTVWPQGARVAAARRLLWLAMLGAAIASFVLVVEQLSAASGSSVLHAMRPGQLVDALRFRFGRIAAFRVALLAVAAVLTSRLHSGGPAVVRSRQWSAAAAAVAVGLFETIVLLGHEGGDALSMASRFVHALGVSIWLGGLVMLIAVVLPRRQADELADVLPRFSRLATGAVALVLTGGIALAIELVGARHALPTTPYGRVLTVKVVVVAGLLAVATGARHQVRRRLPDGGPTGPGSIAALVGVELALLACVLAATAVLLAQAPPR